MSIDISDSGLLRTSAYIDGQWVDADDGGVFEVTNPANGEVIATVARGGTAESRRAIEAADKAMRSWRATTIKERAGLLRRWFNLMMDAQQDLAKILTAEQGKPLAEARGCGSRRARTNRWPRRWARLLTARATLNGFPKKPSASMATSYPARARTNALS